jgi:hypothetical protein
MGQVKESDSPPARKFSSAPVTKSTFRISATM